MEASQDMATIAIVIAHPDPGIRELMMAQFTELRQLLTAALGEDWIWTPMYEDHGKATARISVSIPAVNIYRQEDWPQLISFFKPRMIALDEFWSQAQYGFDLFR